MPSNGPAPPGPKPPASPAPPPPRKPATGTGFIGQSGNAPGSSIKGLFGPSESAFRERSGDGLEVVRWFMLAAAIVLAFVILTLRG